MNHYRQGSIHVQHFSFPGKLLFWVPISLRILVNHAMPLGTDVDSCVTVLGQNEWQVKPCVIERGNTVITTEPPSNEGIINATTTYIYWTIFWHTFYIQPSDKLVKDDPGYKFEVPIRFGIGILDNKGVLIEHQYPPDSGGLVIAHQPVCFFDAYVLSNAGGCQASTAPRSVPPELYHQQRVSRALTADQALDQSITEAVTRTHGHPSYLVIDHFPWRVHIRVWGKVLDWKKRDERGREINKRLMDDNIRLINNGILDEQGPVPPSNGRDTRRAMGDYNPLVYNLWDMGVSSMDMMMNSDFDLGIQETIFPDMINVNPC